MIGRRLEAVLREALVSRKLETGLRKTLVGGRLEAALLERHVRFMEGYEASRGGIWTGS